MNSGRGGLTSIYTTTRQKSYKINTQVRSLALVRALIEFLGSSRVTIFCGENGDLIRYMRKSIMR